MIHALDKAMERQGKPTSSINPPLRPWLGLCLAVAHAIRRQQIVDTLLLERFQGPDGKLHLVEALRAQTLVRDEDLAVELARRVTLKAVPAGAVLITQEAPDRDLFLILSGTFSVTVMGRMVASRSAGEHVGEMAVVDPGAPVRLCGGGHRLCSGPDYGARIFRARGQISSSLAENRLGTGMPPARPKRCTHGDHDSKTSRLNPGSATPSRAERPAVGRRLTA